ncbi:lysostaphin resistance A-like protein [Streptomyces sp. MMS24-I29]|uniref:CPBP family intramembrane glutamic endopeptidase n=1 Tax=Streptomyces sp. MMS24-I29 TaxID=3351480 RepID=UPI003C7B3518
MAATLTKNRLLTIVWCAGLPAAVVTAYLGLGIVVVTAVGEPVLGTAVLGVAVTAVVGAVRLLRPRWLTYEPGPLPRPGTPRFMWLTLSALALAFLAGQAAALWLYSVAGSNGFDQSQEAREAAGPGTVLLLTLVVAPVAEEMLFRGLLYPLLRRRAGVIASVLVTAAAFSVLHGNAVQAASALPLAVLLALVYERTRALWPCVLVHLGFNLAATAVPAPALAGFANPVSAMLLTAAFLGSALVLYRKIAGRAGDVPAGPDRTGGGTGEEGETDETRTA